MSHNGPRRVGNKAAEDSLLVRVRLPVDGKSYMYLHSYICSYIDIYSNVCKYDYILRQMRVLDVYFELCSVCIHMYL